MIAQLYTLAALKELRARQTLLYSGPLARVRTWSPLGEVGLGSSVVRSCGVVGERLCRTGPRVRGGCDSSPVPRLNTQGLPLCSAPS